jgi:S-adenosyl-L-methionine hydrolase (adenosine-forming)
MIITLTTDFGLSDPFVGIMKGVILGITPNAQLVDISHDIPSYNVAEAVFVVESMYRYFPEGTVHIVVVDPGVGSQRRPLAAAAQGHLFVAPDNGVLSAVLQDEAYHIQNDRLWLKSVSHTFHGRDIFAPVAAHLAGGTPIDSVGPRIHDFVRKPLPAPRPRGRKISGTVLRVDKFGNLITNLRRSDLSSPFTIRIGGLPIDRLCANFSEADPGELVAVEGSTGYIEIVMNRESAAERLKVSSGAEIEVESDSAKH